ncbi:MAG: hypothetical protein CMP57_02030 [Flavobacteriales bacterium]|nr:hypothetical protein [Flavobacteriales bacterium]|tara:strand:- start:546 stop:875 length:330 start_codon:yes stop_codon:yes gene_type:complete
MFDEPEYFEYSSPDEALEKFTAPMELMYEFAIGNKCFSSTLTEHNTHYFTSYTGDVVATYSLNGDNFTVYPFDPTNITKEDIQKMIDYFEEREEFEKCANLLKLKNEDN